MLDSEYIWFSTSNEDSSSEITALELDMRSRVLCVTASGSRPIDLLTADVREIISVDQNPSQTALAELKIVSLQKMTYSNWVEFLGLIPSTCRLEAYQALRMELSDATRLFWDRHLRLIEGGVLYCGKWESYFDMTSRIGGRHVRALAEELFAFKDVQLQYEFWKAHWDGILWRIYLRFLSSRWLWRYYLKDPGVDLVDDEFSIYRYCYSRLDHAARNTILAQSPLAWLLFFGRYEPTEALPLYLQKENFPILKERASRINLVTSSLQGFLAEETSGIFDAFSLSDFSSYCNRDVQDHLWWLISRHISPRGRVCQRLYMNKTESIIANSELFFRDRRMEDILFDRNSAYFYSFVIARPENYDRQSLSNGTSPRSHIS